MQRLWGMEPTELMLTAARTTAVYVLRLVVIRALGKRTVGNFSAFDLLVALMLGEVVDEIIYGDVRFLQGAVAIVAIAALAYADAWLAYWDHGMDAVLVGKPSIVVRDGEFDREGMRSDRFTVCARSAARPPEADESGLTWIRCASSSASSSRTSCCSR